MMLSILLLILLLGLPAAIIFPIVFRKRKNRSLGTQEKTQMANLNSRNRSSINEQQELTVKLGESFLLSGKEHGSVGITYHLEYDEAYFNVSKTSRYSNLKFAEKPMCGGDEAIASYTVSPKSKGTFVLNAISSFRGTVEKNVQYRINVI